MSSLENQRTRVAALRLDLAQLEGRAVGLRGHLCAAEVELEVLERQAAGLRAALTAAEAEIVELHRAEAIGSHEGPNSVRSPGVL